MYEGVRSVVYVDTPLFDEVKYGIDVVTENPGLALRV